MRIIGVLVGVLVDEADRFLRREHVPDPIACQKDELGVRSDCLHLEVRMWRDGLLFGGEVRVVLVFEVAKGA